MHLGWLKNFVCYFVFYIGQLFLPAISHYLRLVFHRLTDMSFKFFFFFFFFFSLYWTTRWIAVRMKIELKTDIVTTTFRKVLILKLFFCWFTRKHSVALSHFQYYGKFGCISRMSRWLLKASYVFRATLLHAVLIVWRENTSCGLDKTQGQNIL